jgi:uncharacterized protein DUF1801
MPSKKSDPAVDAYLAGIVNEARRADCVTLIEMMRKATKHEPKMWGTMVGFGDLHYRYESGREGDTFLLGFASRKPDLTLYLGACLADLAPSLVGLGKHTLSKGCLYIRRLEDVDLAVLRRALAAAAQRNRQMAAPRDTDP